MVIKQCPLKDAKATSSLLLDLGSFLSFLCLCFFDFFLEVFFERFLKAENMVTRPELAQCVYSTES